MCVSADFTLEVLATETSTTGVAHGTDASHVDHDWINVALVPR